MNSLISTLQRLNDIADSNGGNRAFGYPGYAASVDYIFDEISKLDGFAVWKQNFPALFTNTTAADITIGDESLRTVALTYTPSTPEEGIFAQVILGPEGEDACFIDNYKNINAEGNVILVERGLCPDQTTFAGKVKPAAAAGAAAVILYNSDPSKLTAGSLSNPSPEYVPSALIDQEPGQALKARIEGGENVEAHVTIIQLIEERITQNVFAETKGGDAQNVIMFGSHLDSVPAGAGINDDGSGTSLNLQLARGLSNFSTQLKIRFGWWGAEENGLWGSRFYVNNLTRLEIDDILLYINFDMVSRGFWGVFDGDGDEAGPGGAPGSDVIESLFVEHLAGQGLEITPVGLTGGTDYVPFMDIINKPVGGLFTGAAPAQDSCYHQACDNLGNVVPEILTTNAKAAAHVLSVLAIDGRELIPKTPANGTSGSFKASMDPASPFVSSNVSSHSKLCDHDII